MGGDEYFRFLFLLVMAAPKKGKAFIEKEGGKKERLKKSGKIMVFKYLQI